ncbi:hypothetical protein BO83DRAFT_383833 [Aspergillus eucalypticola CBS 122712]|uniref:Uncharacterized protein n=1 Tax=Aspergillus eucalypticola (strain CBS 122712 / IBT 29274) TaxID=1448314 RepID=A0A317UL65_ASPEC|nr:uncharacterized protein BO83DRAFT_383859 [Aspergillus eucalypticola CBS 122712]XP_025381762.1 uncharacterized protein BO83DRAFT_383833 [Aspergillus eucalypticola CBS 122712]PWY61427.1 hypothetical protein BO83DRAFT_383859 [Aspergillus eucalypticola CBS 122712]PWY61661.1 hypothetical protein BO83DRAFT_383833 [Aspergillus eucalypticola CBS 122712]
MTTSLSILEMEIMPLTQNHYSNCNPQIQRESSYDYAGINNYCSRQAMHPFGSEEASFSVRF